MNQDAALVEDIAAPVWETSWLGRLRDSWRDGDIPILCDLSIRLRFGLLVGLAVLAAGTFGAVYSVSEHSIHAMAEAQNDYRRLNDLAGDARAKATALHTHQEQFLRERDPGLAAAFRDDVQFIGDSLAAMRNYPESAALEATLGQLATGFQAAGATFEALTKTVEAQGLTENTGLRGQLRESVKAAEDELKMWPNAGPLLPTMLQMRQAEKNFMLYGAESYLGVHRKYAAQFDFELDGSALPASTRGDLRQLIQAYAADMQAYARITLALNGQVAALRDQLRVLQPQLQQVFSYAREGMLVAIEQQEATRARTTNVTAMVGVLAVLSFFLASLVVARSISQPVRRIERAMNHLAAGNHEIEIPGIGRRNEIGDMAKAVMVFKDNAAAIVRLQREQEMIRAEAQAANRAKLLEIAGNFESTVKSVADAVACSSTAIKQTAERMARREEVGESRSLSVAQAAEQSRATVEVVAEAARELTISVDDISRQVGNASDVVHLAVTELGRANERVQGLAEVAGRIDRIVNLIGDIAARTNMLSMNATIEASRAGEAGKGFAVVAGEVKKLAHQTAESSGEIAQQVAAIQAATAETVSAIADVGTAIRRMDEIAGSVSHAVARQAAVTDKIARSVEVVAEDTRNVTEGVVAVTQSAARYCGSAIRVMWAADDLAGPASTLESEVKRFLATVRAG